MSDVIYLRKSRADLELESRSDEDVLARHEAELRRNAARLGRTVTAVYREVVSGDTITARPMMQRLLYEVESGMWDAVHVVETSRLARGDTIDQGVVARAFRYSGTLIITPSKIVDPNNEYDEDYFEFDLFMSRREYKAITRRMQRGRVASAREGKWVANRAPFGYDRVKLEREKGWTLVPNADADIVRDIFAWYTSGGRRLSDRPAAERDRRTLPEGEGLDKLRRPGDPGESRLCRLRPLGLPACSKVRGKRECQDLHSPPK